MTWNTTNKRFVVLVLATRRKVPDKTTTKQGGG
jgi:hypothetical protein